MYNEIQRKKDLALIERIDKMISRRIEFLLYFLALIACLAAHALYLGLFAAAGAKAMAIFNIFSVCFYAVMIFLVRKVKERLNIVYASLAEIIIHAAAATVCVGLKPDFCMFLLMIIPLAFLMPNKNRYVPFVVMFVSVPLYGVLRYVYLNPGREIYDLGVSSYSTVFYIINIIVGSFVLIYVATIFTVINLYNGSLLRVQNEQLRVLASTDPLTRLSNRREMNRRLTEICSSSGKRYVIGLADIDNFKKVNDTYGHDQGDTVLSAVAGIMTDSLSENGSAARWGGEEFLFIIPDADTDKGLKYAESMIKSVGSKQFTSDGKTFSVTMTIGLCEGQQGDNIEKVINHADSRLYKGKHNGKNRVEYED